MLAPWLMVWPLFMRAAQAGGDCAPGAADETGAEAIASDGRSPPVAVHAAERPAS